MTARTGEVGRRSRPPATSRRSWRRTALTLTAVVVALAGASPTPSAVAEPRADLVGKWDVLVTIGTQPTQYAPLFCDFYVDHRLQCVNKPGLPELVGNGIWQQTGGSSFTFWLTHHAQRDAAGNAIGSIYALHTGTMHRRNFTTEGTTFIALDDSSPWIGPIPVSSEGHRLPKSG